MCAVGIALAANTSSAESIGASVGGAGDSVAGGAGGGAGGSAGGGPPPPGAAVGELSDASRGNLLEAVNLALDVLECSYEEQDLSMTGKSVVVLSPGSGAYEVDYRLSQMTKQRILDDGIAAGFKWPPPCLRTPPHLPLWTV